MRSLFRCITQFLVGFCCFSIALIVALQVSEVRCTLTKAIAATIEVKTGWKIQVETLNGLLPLEVRARNVTISDSKNELCRIEEVDFAISPLDLFHGTVVLSHLRITGFNCEAQPEDFATFTLQGELALSLLTHELSGDLNIRNPEGKASHLSFTLNREEWSAEVTEKEHGLIQTLVGAPFSTSFKATVNLDSECQARFQSRALGVDIISKWSIIDPHLITLNSLNGHVSHYDMALNGEVAIDLTAQTLKGQLELNPLPAPELSGIIEGSISVDGTLSRPTLILNVLSPHLDWMNTPLDKVHAECHCTVENAELDSRWNLSGLINSIPVQVTTRAHYAQFLDITELIATVPSGVISGRGHLGDQFLCHLEGNLQDLNKIGAPFQFPIDGSISFDWNLSPNSHKLTVLGREIQLRDCTFEKLTFQQEGPTLSHFNYALSAQHITWNNLSWDELSLGTSVSLDRQTWPFTLMATGQDGKTMEVNASGQWHVCPDEIFIHLGLLTGKLLEHPLHLVKPFNCNVTNTSTRTSQIELSLGGGSIAFEGKFDEQEVNCLLECQHCPVDCANDFLPYDLKVKGTGSLFLRLMGPLHDIQGSMALKGNDITIYDESQEELPISNGKIEAVLADNALTFDGCITSLDNPLLINGILPFQVSLDPLNITLPLREPVKTHLTTSGEISPYLRLFVTDTTNVEGHIEIDIDMGGTVERPIIEGRAELTHGLFESLNTGLVIRDIECLLIGNDKKLHLDHFTGNDGGAGTISAEGYFELSQDDQYPFELNVDLDQAVAVRLDYADMATSGAVKLVGNLSGGKITGDVTVDRVTLEIPEKIPAQMKTVEVTFINEPKEKGSIQSKKKKDPWPIELDVNFIVPANFFVLGRDLESEWRGQFSFGGTTLNPKVYGTLELLRGEYSFNGKSFTSTQGSVNFAGDPGSKTTLYVVGEQQIDNIKVQAILKGDLQAPDLSFRSNPNMSEKEILAWILFGHGIDEITPFQKEQLTESVFTLSSGENSDMISQLRRDMGIDRLDISSHATDERNELSLRIGKYISRGIYVSLSKSINAEANQVAIEANVTRHLKVQAEVGDNAEGKMSLKWARDY